MNTLLALGRTLVSLVGLSMLLHGCVIEPREGYYDRDHHRWYHEHHWRDCDEHEERCRADR